MHKQQFKTLLAGCKKKKVNLKQVWRWHIDFKTSSRCKINKLCTFSRQTIMLNNRSWFVTAIVYKLSLTKQTCTLRTCVTRTTNSSKGLACRAKMPACCKFHRTIKNTPSREWSKRSNFSYQLTSPLRIGWRLCSNSFWFSSEITSKDSPRYNKNLTLPWRRLPLSSNPISKQSQKCSNLRLYSRSKKSECNRSKTVWNSCRSSLRPTKDGKVSLFSTKTIEIWKLSLSRALKCRALSNHRHILLKSQW